jgi:MoaA/NifB/PqqE/SkfB family radical SAM enzyme
VSEQYDRLVRRASAAHVPLSVLFEVTHRCNLGCEHCYLTEGPVGRPRPTREELTLDEIRRVLDELARAGALFLTLSGGEVFLRRDFLDIVAAARARNFSVTVFTTGTLLTPRTAQALAALHPLSVEISVYSVRPEVHDRVTNIPGSHARSLAALRLLREAGVTILIKSPLMSITSGEYRELLALAESLEAGCGFDPMLVPRRDGDRAPLALAAKREDLRAFFSDPVLAREWAQPVPCLPDRREELCGSARRTCMISPYGEVFACAVHPLPAGTLRERSFDDIWHHAPLLRSIRSKTTADLREGAGGAGGFRCSALALIEDGDYLGRFRRGEAMAEVHAQAQRQSR